MAAADVSDALPYDIWLTAEFSPRVATADDPSIDTPPGPAGAKVLVPLIWNL